MSFSDDFSGEGSTVELDAHTPSGGTAWTKIGGDATNKINVRTDGTAAVNTPTPVSVAYYCDDQGSADHESYGRFVAFDADHQDSYITARMLDEDNFFGVKIFGVGSLGRRLSEVVAGSATDFEQGQGSANEWLKVICTSGDNIQLWSGGTGSTPSWSQIGSDTNDTTNNTETTQGVRAEDNTIGGWISDFGAASLAAAGGVTIPIIMRDRRMRII